MEKFWVMTRGQGFNYDTLTTTEVEDFVPALALANQVNGKLYLATITEGGSTILLRETDFIKDAGFKYSRT